MLVQGEDYSITYEDNIEPGKAKATIIGINDYTGQIELEFIILPRAVTNLSLEKHVGWLRAHWSEVEEADGYEIHYCKTGRPETIQIIDLPGHDIPEINLENLERGESYEVEVYAYANAEEEGSAPYYGETDNYTATVPDLPTIEDCWGFRNPAIATVEKKHLMKYFPLSKAMEISSFWSGHWTGGVCFGMCLSTYTSWFYDNPEPSEIGVNCLSEIGGWDTIGNEKIEDTIIYSQLYEQTDWNVQVGAGSYNLFAGAADSYTERVTTFQKVSPASSVQSAKRWARKIFQ